MNPGNGAVASGSIANNEVLLVLAKVDERGTTLSESSSPEAGADIASVTPEAGADIASGTPEAGTPIGDPYS